MEIRQMKSFIKIAELGNITRAAEELGYSQAALTIQIQKMEGEMGVPLFERVGKRMTLTAKGKRIYPMVFKLLKQEEYIREAVMEEKEPEGEVVIGTIESICDSVLTQFLEIYHSLYPKVKVKIQVDSPSVLLDGMNRNQIDVVLLLDQKLWDSKWKKTYEEKEDMFFVCKKGLYKKRKYRSKDLINMPFILTEKNASYRYALDELLKKEELRISPYIEVGNTNLILDLIKNGGGVTFLPKYVVKEELERGTLEVLEVEGISVDMYKQVLHHKEKWISKEMELFLKLLRESSHP